MNPVFPPSMFGAKAPEFQAAHSDMANMNQYAKRLCDYCDHESGIVVVRPPPGWEGECVLEQRSEMNAIKIKSYLIQSLKSNADGVFDFSSKKRKFVGNVGKFHKKFGKDRRWMSGKKFWGLNGTKKYHYAADIDTRVFPDHVRTFDSILNSEKFKENKIPGVTRPYGYVGTRGSFFPFHREDGNLFSSNYLVSGAPKRWYGIAPQYVNRGI